MNISTIRVLALFGLIAITGPSAVMAQDPFHVTIPFNFTVTSKSLPAGGYRVSETSHGVIWLRSEDNRTNMAVVTHTGERGKNPLKTVLIFHRYGAQYFLSSVSNYNRGWVLPRTTSEKELIADKGVPQPFQIAASSGK
jgi:hypothetical protein